MKHYGTVMDDDMVTCFEKIKLRNKPDSSIITDIVNLQRAGLLLPTLLKILGINLDGFCEYTSLIPPLNKLLKAIHNNVI